MAQSAQLPKEKIVQIVLGMLEKGGENLAAELQRRIDAGTGLQVRGIKVDVSMLTEALDKFEELHPDESCPAASSTAKAPAPTVGARWDVGAPSASLMSARALQECEKAEVCCRTVKVASGSGEVRVLSRPDILAAATDGEEPLRDGQKTEVVARFCAPKDGRVYLRLKSQTGWVSTRCRENMTKVVLEPLPGEASLEPLRCRDDVDSTALKLLPLLDPETESLIAAPMSPAPALPPAAARASGSGASSPGASPLIAPASVSPQIAPASIDQAPGEDGPEPIELNPSQEGHEEDEEEEEEDGEDIDGEEECDGEGEGAEVGGGGAAASSCSPGKRTERHFKVVLSRVPVLEAPGMEHLDKPGHARWLMLKEEFAADGVVYLPAEARSYLRLRHGRGWVCERARNDLRRFAVVPMVRRKQKLSKKMAKAVAFRGGDTDGMTRLKKEDLVKNSHGKIVSKKASEAAKKRYADSSISRWTQAVKQARSEMGVSGFLAVKKGTAVYDKAQEFYKAMGGEGQGQAKKQKAAGA